MPIATPTVGLYPSIDQVFLLTRILTSDLENGPTTTVGEPRVFTDPWTPSLNFLNLALQALQRDLETFGLATTREQSFILNGLSPINGPLGLATPDPATTVYLGFMGYFDGSTLHGGVVLPPDLLNPMKIRTRVTGSGTVFREIHEAPDGLPSVIQSPLGLGRWEWRQDRLNFNGSLATIDIEMFYTGGVSIYPLTLSPDIWATTLIPFLDSGDALAYKCAYLWAAPRLPAGTADYLDANYRDRMMKMANRWVPNMPLPVKPVKQGAA